MNEQDQSELFEIMNEAEELSKEMRQLYKRLQDLYGNILAKQETNNG